MTIRKHPYLTFYLINLYQISHCLIQLSCKQPLEFNHWDRMPIYNLHLTAILVYCGLRKHLFQFDFLLINFIAIVRVSDPIRIWIWIRPTRKSGTDLREKPDPDPNIEKNRILHKFYQIKLTFNFSFDIKVTIIDILILYHHFCQ